MPSIDYQAAKKEIERIFAKAEGREVVFWYDAPGNFKEDVTEDIFDFCRLLICDRNEFEIKKAIEHDDLTSNFLVYIPEERPADQENWLLDVLLYSKEYYADTVALIMRRFSLSNIDLRRVIENHQKFFDSEARSKKLASYVTINDHMTTDDLKLAMMAVLVKATSGTVESILTELVFDDGSHTKMNELLKYKFGDYLWDKICEGYNYEGDLKIELLTKKFMFTAFLEQGTSQSASNPFGTLPPFYDQYTIAGRGVNDARFFVEKLKSDRRYEVLQRNMAFEMKIEGLISSRDIAVFQSADVFECVDANIISRIANSLQNGSLDYEAFERMIYNRVNSMWYNAYKTQYEMLLHGIKFMKRVEKVIPAGLTAVEYIQKYQQEWYRIDMEYRLACTNYKKIENPAIEFEKLSDRIELLYQCNYLEKLGREYSAALAKMEAWRFVGVDMNNDFFRYIQRNPAKKIFVIISDALRYEVGYELYEQIKADPVLGGVADIDCAVSPLPSETQQGMAALLPHKEITFDGQGYNVDGMPTNGIAARNAVLQAKNASYAGIQFEKINGMSRNELRQYMQDKSLVYIYHNVIDNAGEHSESKVFDVVQEAIDEIVGLVKKLHGNLQITNFYITADHGFFYRQNVVEESSKYSNITSLESLALSKRYLLTDNPTVTIPYSTEFKLPDVAGGNYRVITPNSYDLFKTQGAGLQYIHGGASLQETIVPVIHISEMRSKQTKENIGPVGVRLKSITRKATNRSFTLEFEQYEKVEEKKQPITCETFFVDENGDKVSSAYKFVANSSSDDPITRVTKIRFVLDNIPFDRNKPYYLILRNTEKPDEYIEREAFTIDILGFKMF